MGGKEKEKKKRGEEKRASNIALVFLLTSRIYTLLLSITLQSSTMSKANGPKAIIYNIQYIESPPQKISHSTKPSIPRKERQLAARAPDQQVRRVSERGGEQKAYS